MSKHADEEADRTAAAYRKIQEKVDAGESPEGGGHERKAGAMQAGARRYPEPPLPRQHQAKPGSEADLDPEPMYDAPFYRGSGKLEGKVAIVTGGDSGIGRSVAVLFAREGADVAIVYLNEDEDAETTRLAVKRRRAENAS